MDLKQWKWCQPEYDELLPLGRLARVGETTVFLLGFLRRGEQVELCALEYDPAYNGKAPTHRAQIRSNRQNVTAQLRHKGPDWPLIHTQRLEAGGNAFHTACGSGDLLRAEDPRGALILGAFFRAGVVVPSELEDVDMARLNLCTLELRQSSRRIPKVLGLSAVRCYCGPDAVCRPARRKLILEVGKPYPRPIVCGRGAERTVFYIQDVSLYDWLGETEQRLKDPQYTAGMGPERMEEFQTRVFPAMEKKCPRGKRVVIVTYESAGVQPELYLTDYLDRAPEYSGMGVGMVMRASQERGAHGLPLRPLVLEGAVEADAFSVEVELLGVMVHKPEYCFLI